ncbi:MAG: TonB-dependent receptor [Chitinophagales bacterium]|nr:TonB-dependent receptor [Chitinophagales bacterium]MCZ2392473.1 TonB-dependent receptor [Chitinophagales bacterium]
MKKNVLLWLLAVLFSTTQVLAQNRTVSGVVTDAEDEQPLIGVSVVVKGTTIGTSTGIDGDYRLDVPADAKILVFSYVGFGTQEVAITSNSINVKLKSGVQLEEVVVMGYSAVKKSDLTAAVSEVKGEKLQNIPIGGIDNLLQGKASGVQITALNGRPGGNAYIRIRGTGSLNASSEPLILVDGVEISTRDYAMINPADIADMVVLKDAAAAAIYGSRASNGVILVTTKRGTGSTMKKFNIQYSYNRSVKTKTKDNFDLMSAEEKIGYERGLNKGNAEILALQDDEIADFISKNRTDWFKVLLRKAAVETHDVSVSGSSEDFNYYLSFGSYKEDGLTYESKFDRINVRFNSDYRANKWLKVGNSFTVAQAEDNVLRDRYNAQNPFAAMYFYNPYEPVYAQDADGNVIYDDNGNPEWNYTTQGFNALEGIKTAPNIRKYLNLIGNVYAQVDIVKGLALKTDVGIKHRSERRNNYLYPGSILDGYVGNPAAPGSLTQASYQNILFKWSNVASYNTTLKDKHNLSLLAGTELLKTDYESTTATGIGFTNKNLMQLGISALPQRVGGTKIKYALFSLFGEAQYNYLNKYLASISVRRDGSTAFGPENRYGTFYGASVGWNIAKESFLANVKNINQLKLRASLGTSGNDRIGDFLYLSTYNLGSYGDLTSSFPATPANPKLKWESNFNWNIGLDFGFFNNRLSGSVEYYDKNTNDLLFPVALSYTSGFSSQTQNIGKMNNRGVETELRVDAVRKKNGNLSLYGNFSYNKNKVVSIPTEEEFLPTSGRGLGLTVLKEGLEAYTFYLTRWAGVDASNGKPLYYDKDGNVTDVYSDGDNVILEGKSVLPKWYGGFGLNADFYGVFVDADFYYSGGNYTMNLIARDLLSDGENITGPQRVEALNYWKKPGDVTEYPNPVAAGFVSRTTDKWLQKGDYLRLRSLRVGYNLPSSILSKAKIANLSVYFQGTNLFTVTKYEGDPEVGMGSEESSTGSLGIPGEASLYSYPQFRAFSFGVNIGF